MLRIRPFEAQHARGVADLIVPIQRDEFGVGITLEDQPDLHAISDFYLHGRGNFWVALNEESRVIGSLGLLDIGNGEAALRKMFVMRDYRGAEHAVARQLLDVLLAWSLGRGLKRIYLGTTEKFLAAHRFYEKNGFVEIGRQALPATFPVMDVDNKFYCRELRADEAA